MYRCRLLLDGNDVGEVRWRVDGNRVSVCAECPFEENRIYRVAVCGENSRLALGVMLPQRKRFVVQRRLPVYKAGLLLHTPSCALHGEIVRALPGECRTPPLPFALAAAVPLPENYGAPRSPLLCRCARQTEGLLLGRHDGYEYLIFPIGAGEELPFSPFFCLMTPLWLEGRLYGVLCVDKTGEVCRFEPDTKTDGFFSG